MMMTCREVRYFLVDYVTAELSDLEREEFDAHVSVCSECARELRRTREAYVFSQRIVAVAHDPSPLDVPDELIRAIMSLHVRSADCCLSPHASHMAIPGLEHSLFSDTPIRHEPRFLG